MKKPVVPFRLRPRLVDGFGNGLLFGFNGKSGLPLPCKSDDGAAGRFCCCTQGTMNIHLTLYPSDVLVSDGIDVSLNLLILCLDVVPLRHTTGRFFDPDWYCIRPSCVSHSSCQNGLYTDCIITCSMDSV